MRHRKGGCVRENFYEFTGCDRNQHGSGAVSPRVISNLSLCLLETGNFAEAEAFGLEAIQVGRAVLGAESPFVVRTIDRFARSFARVGGEERAAAWRARVTREAAVPATGGRRATMPGRLRTEREVARSLDGSRRLLPFLGELLADQRELGGSAREVLAAVRPLGLPPGSRVLDLGCGKGAVAIALAKRRGLRVLGVDGFRPFIEEAKRRAREEGVERLCRFRCADLRSALRGPAEFDLLLYIAMGPLLGNAASTVRRLRRRVRPGGHIVIDDGFLRSRSNRPAVYRAYTDHAGTIARLASCGDEIVSERVVPAEIRDRKEGRIVSSIARRADLLARRRPEVAAALRGYVRAQERESARMGRTLLCATWVLRRSEGKSERPRTRSRRSIAAKGSRATSSAESSRDGP